MCSFIHCLCSLPDYKIVIICSSEDEEKSHVISKLQLYHRAFSALQPNSEFAEYLMSHFKRWPEEAVRMGRTLVASTVDCDQ